MRVLGDGQVGLPVLMYCVLACFPTYMFNIDNREIETLYRRTKDLKPTNVDIWRIFYLFLL